MDSAKEQRAPMKRALLIGSPLYLYGVENDLKAMNKVLQEKYQFTNITMCGAEGTYQYDATRHGILQAFHDFINDTIENDQAVVYFSGHGAVTERADSVESDDLRRIQYLVPLDYNQTETEEINIITSIQVSDLLLRLTAKTQNVTLILDCCCSAQLARDGARVRALRPERYQHVNKLIQGLIEKGEVSHKYFAEGNPHVVRVVAAAATESGYENKVNGEDIGFFTKSLVDALNEIPAENQVSWKRIMENVCNRVQQLHAGQHPQVEGPSRRFCFSLDEEDPSGGIPVSIQGNEIMLNGGLIHGVEVGDVYAIVPFQAEGVTDDQLIAEITVTRCFNSSAFCTTAWRNDHEGLPDGGAHAILTRKALKKFSVLVKGSDTFYDQVLRHISHSRHVSYTEADDGVYFACLEQQLEKDNPSLTLEIMDRRDQVIRRWAGVSNERIQEYIRKSIDALECLARAHHVLSLKGQYRGDAPFNFFAAAFGKVENDNRVLFGENKRNTGEGGWFPETKPTAYNLDRLYIDLRNESTDRLFVSILEVCLDTVIHITESSPNGVEVPASRTVCIGWGPNGELEGLTLRWPDYAPHDRSLDITLILVVSDGPVDLTSLESIPGQNTRGLPQGSIANTGSELLDFVEQVAWGKPKSKTSIPRVMDRAVRPPLRFCTIQFDYNFEYARPQATN